MSKSEITILVLSVLGTLVATSLPIATLLWKVFNVVARDKQSDEFQQLAINGLRERIEHCATRLTGQNDNLNRRVKQVERFLAKTTNFEERE